MEFTPKNEIDILLVVIMRYFVEIGYSGTHYHGWQTQINATSVQDEVEKVLQTLLGKTTPIVGSSRTDTGVHCLKQYFHLDVEHAWDIPQIMHKLNIMLPKDIAIYTIRRVNSDAHARYSAIRRHYEYRITLQKNPFLQHYAYYFFREVDLDTMNQAAAVLIGQHNFKAFSKVKTDTNHFICKLEKARWRREGKILLFEITANRFLRGMVRAIVGSLLDVGTGKITVQDFCAIMESEDRRKASMNAPPQGLSLLDVEYPDNVFVS